MSILIVAGLIGIVAFSFRPEAERLARTSLFLPTLLAGAGSVILKIAFDGWRKGVARPLIRGIPSEYYRTEQPRRYWAAMAWNCLLGGGLLFLSPQTWEATKEQRCFAPEGETAANDAIAACDLFLANQTASPSARARGLRSRAKWHELNGDDKDALADYDRSLEADNSKAETFYLRGKLHASHDRPLLAKEDFNGALLLDPDHFGALFERGRIKLDDGDLIGAIEDFDQANALQPNDVWTLANRGLAHAWSKQFAEAERDFAAADALDRDNWVTAHGRVAVSIVRDDFRQARQRLAVILDRNPRDEWAHATLARLEKFDKSAGEPGAARH